MLAAIRKAAPLMALAGAAILGGCAVEPAPYYGEAYYTGPSAVFVGPVYHYGYYGHPYGPGYHWGGGMHGRG
jgi:hypothetical protein